MSGPTEVDSPMQDQTLPEFDQLADLLLAAESLASPTDLQAVACGRLCGGAQLTQAEWHKLAGLLMDVETLEPALADSLDRLLAATRQQLSGDGFALDLMLPDDGIELAMRLQSLAGWCSSFLHGFGGAGIKGDQQFSAQAAEALRDIAAMAQLDSDIDDEGAEGDYMELVEYLRMAVLTLYLELAGRAKLH